MINEIPDINKNYINKEIKDGLIEYLLKLKTFMPQSHLDKFDNKFKNDNDPNHTHLDPKQNNISEKDNENSDFNNERNNKLNNDNNFEKK